MVINMSCDIISHTGSDEVIIFVYPKEDWTAAEMAMKMQAFAASQDIDVYFPPKAGRRNEELIARKLSKGKYAIFLAHDKTELDDDTKWEINYLKKRGTPLYSIVPDNMVNNIKNFGIINNIYEYDANNPEELKNALEKLLRKIKASSSDSDAGALLTFLAVVGLGIFLIWLLLGKEER